jgi:hypothetical protein
MIPIEIFFASLIVAIIASYVLGRKIRHHSPPSPPNKVQWDLEREG